MKTCEISHTDTRVLNIKVSPWSISRTTYAEVFWWLDIRQIAPQMFCNSNCFRGSMPPGRILLPYQYGSSYAPE